jgi:RNA polymerase sigma-70 factor (ECF subfamily)
MPHRRELHVHCYRMLGSFDDADDAVQETLMAAWRKMDAFGGRASVRTWLYRIATNTCLNLLRGSARRPQKAQGGWAAGGQWAGDSLRTAGGQQARDAQGDAGQAGRSIPAHFPATTPAPNGYAEVTWLQPYPDALLDDLPDDAPGPDTVAERNEAISLAVTSALQLLTPRARATLILRDVLCFSAREVAGILDSTEEAVAMALSRARSVLREPGAADPEGTGHAAGGPWPDEAGRRLAVDLATALTAHDVSAVVRLLADDVRISMPPFPATWQGRELAAGFLTEVAFRLVPEARFVPAGANRQPALAAYARDAASGAWRANGLLVITVTPAPREMRISALTRFEPAALRPFGLPGILSDDG